MKQELLYKVIKAPSSEDLEKKVSIELAKRPDWDIAGGLIATSDAYGRVFYQAITKKRMVRKARAKSVKHAKNTANATSLLEGVIQREEAKNE